MKNTISLVVLVICIMMPIVLTARQAKDVPVVQAIAARSLAGETPVVTAGNSPQDKQKPPYDQAPEAKTTVHPKYPDLATKAA